MSASSSVTHEKTEKICATLLVVDDNARMRKTISRAFEAEGHRVIAAADAPAALRLLHQEKCELVLLDVEMPGIDGLALCRLLRAQTATKRLPIIVISAFDDEDRKVEAFTSGADDFVVKPFTPRELVSRVNAHLEAAMRESALVGSNRELSFLADLGRGLLCALEPAQLVKRVAGATYEGANAALCAAVAYTPLHESGDGAIDWAMYRTAVCLFDREGMAQETTRLIEESRLRAWLARAPSASIIVADKKQFILRDAAHLIEYIAPLRFEGRALGALVVGFDRRADCGEAECRLVDAAAQQATLALHISSLYAAAKASTVSLAKEVERRTAETEEQRRFTEAIIDSLPVSLYVIDRDYRIVAWNRNRELGGLGLPRRSVLGKNIFEILTRQSREVLENEFSRVFATGEIVRLEHETTDAEGKTKHWLISKIPMRDDAGEISHVITVGEDITARVEASRAVARTEKLAAVGRLAAGVVHEINNPLATIAACAEALSARVVEGAFGESQDAKDLREYLELIRSETFRCKSITMGLLNFSRARTGERTPVQLSDVVKSAARLLMHQRRGANIEFVVEAQDNLPFVSADEGQLQQVVIALAENAIDAMPQGGRLTLAAKASRAKEAIIEVSDTGVGIPTEIMAKIFDPFFTTKEVGRGTGLGLAVCYGIVTEHGGRINVKSKEGRGTTFTVALPALNAAPNISTETISSPVYQTLNAPNALSETI
jgi:two-component system NtrC family sensor kinase